MKQKYRVRNPEELNANQTGTKSIRLIRVNSHERKENEKPKDGLPNEVKYRIRRLDSKLKSIRKHQINWKPQNLWMSTQISLLERQGKDWSRHYRNACR
jgi:hypothetical protein